MDEIKEQELANLNTEVRNLWKENFDLKSKVATMSTDIGMLALAVAEIQRVSVGVD